MWSVIAIASRPTSSAVSSSVSTGVAQSGEWSVCMWRSTCTKSREDRRLRTAGAPSGGVAPAGHRAVELLETARPRGPTRARGGPRRCARRSGRARAESVTSRSSWPASVSASRGSNRSPSSPSRTASSYSGSRETTGTAPPASARSTICGDGRAPAGGGHRHGRPRPGTGSPTRPPGPTSVHPVAQPARQGERGRALGVAHPDAWPASRGRRTARRSARRNSRSAPRSSWADSTMCGGPPSAGSGRRMQLGPGRDHLVLAGEEARHRSRVTAKLAVRASRRPNSRSTSGRATWVDSSRSVAEWKLPDVQRAGVAQRRGGRARRERLVHVQEVELGAVEQVLERARDVQRQRHRPPAPEGQALAHRHQARRSRARRTARRGRRASP